MTEETKKALLAGYPEWEIDCRTKGLPSKGSGAIFQMGDEDITEKAFTIPTHWPILAGVDFGRSRDPSTIVFTAINPNDDTIHIFREYYLDQDRSQEAMAEIILNSGYPNIPVCYPHDGHSVSTDGGTETRAAILRKCGVNLLVSNFNNSDEVKANITDSRKKAIGKEGGLVWMGHKMKEGKMKFFDTLTYFFKEKRSYFYVMKGGKFSPKDGDDHVIDATRLATISVEQFGIPAGQCMGGDVESWNNGFSNTEQPNWDY